MDALIVSIIIVMIISGVLSCIEGRKQMDAQNQLFNDVLDFAFPEKKE